jgi:hypothetical protein
MKKTYITPSVLTVQLSSRSTLMSLSATDSLDGTSYGGTTLGNSIIDADVKGFGDKNIWDEEW